MRPEHTERAPIIILGGGPVGLAAALELARCDVPTVVIEQREATSWHPKTRNFNTRTMEIARGWGQLVYQRLRAVDTPDGWKSPIRFFDTVLGKQYGEIESKGFEGPGPEISPAEPVMSSQDLFEEILCDAAVATGIVDLRFGHQATEVLKGWRGGENEAALRVAVKETGETYELSGAALVGADGVDSLVRQQLGISLEGERDLNYFINCYFRSDIESHVRDRSGVLFFVANQNAAGVLQPLDANGRWLCQISVTPDEWSPDVYTSERVRRWVRGAVGIENLDVEVLSIGRWRMNVAVAERLVQGRILLCGDAAHQFPPTGGLGVNTGLQGLHNAMWKLALCSRELAAWSLLGTYETERRPPSKQTADQSLENHRNVARIAAAAYNPESGEIDPAEEIRAARRYGNHLGVEFGTAYSSDAVIPDGTSPPEVDDSYSDYAPSATPGCRAPHVWLGKADQALSTLDLLGPGFTVLTGADGEAWRKAAASSAREYQVPVASYAIGTPALADRAGAFCDLYGITSKGAVLVRPDGYVAWRSASEDASSGAALVHAMGRILQRNQTFLPRSDEN